MTAKEVYELPFESKTNDLNILKGCYYDHIPEVEFSYYGDKIQSNKVEIRFVKHFDYDHRRFWRLATVWFENKPVMIIQNAGREGDDHEDRFITDGALFVEMVAHIRSLLKVDEPKVIDSNKEMPELTSFYSQSLDDPFEVYKY